MTSLPGAKTAPADGARVDASVGRGPSDTAEVARVTKAGAAEPAAVESGDRPPQQGPASTLKLTLRAGQRVYINGAILQVDRKVAIELVNTADFLLEQHVISARDVHSLHQHLYFCIQSVVLSPFVRSAALAMCRCSIDALERCGSSGEDHELLGRLQQLIQQDRAIDALKVLRRAGSTARSPPGI